MNPNSCSPLSLASSGGRSLFLVDQAPVRSVCVYCGSAAGANPRFADEARRLGRLLAEAGIALVYGGGAHGLMGIVASAVLDGGGRVIGVVPQALKGYAEADRPGFERVDVPDMHARKQRMFDEADAIVALPGGIGTLEEVAEQLAWIGLGHHGKPVVLVDIDGFWQPLVRLVAHMREQGFIYLRDEDGFRVVADADGALSHLLNA